MLIFRRLSLVEVAALVTVVVVAGVMVAYGQGMFSPGALSARSRGNVSLGGVAAHAEIKQCEACHAPGWSKESMADRCMSCHTDVRTQLDSHGPLHGKVPDGGSCRKCHSEHRGAHAELTSLTGFDHNWTAFQLTGKHTTTDCRSCHANHVFKGTPQTCVSCHAEPPVPKVHKSHYGKTCSSCHSTTTWSKPTFEHRAFSVNHGSRRNTCSTCHTDLSRPKTYTCYTCHEHRPDKIERIHVRRNIVQFENCVQCHGGRRGRRTATAVEGRGLTVVAR